MSPGPVNTSFNSVRPAAPVMFVDGIRIEPGSPGYNMYMGGGGGIGVASTQYFGVWTGNGPGVKDYSISRGAIYDYASNNPGTVDGIRGNGGYVQLQYIGYYNKQSWYMNPITGNFITNSTEAAAYIQWTEFENLSINDKYSGEVNYNGYNISSDVLMQKLAQFSQYIKQPIEVTSGDRSASRNKAAGGAKASRHLFGDAADVKIKGMTNEEVSILANKSELFNTVIYYPDVKATGGLRPHVHLDLNPAHDNLFLIYTPSIINGKVTRNNYSPYK